jgi:putative peptide zinc metalloprotease protein
MSYYESPSDLYGKSFGFGPPEEGRLFKLRGDLVVRQQTHKKEVFYIVKDPVARSYYKFVPSEWDLYVLFDGQRTPEQIVDEYNKKYPFEGIDEELLDSYRANLKEMELIELGSSEKNLMLMERIRSQRKMRAEGTGKWSNLFYVTFSAWDPDRIFNRIVPYLRFFWTKTFLVVSLIAIFLMLIVNIIKWDEFAHGTIALYSFTNKSLWELLVFIFLMTVTGALHEIGHGLTLKNFGGEVHQVGILLFYLTPAFYCDVSDSYVLNRKDRLWVTFAGTYTELVLCSIATFVWFFAVPGTLLYDFAFQVILFSGISSFFINMNPLVKLDGYYALMDTLEIPDLREEAFGFLGRWFKRNIFRLQTEEPEDTTRRKRRIFVIYGSLAILYTLLVYLLLLTWVRNIYLNTFGQFGYFLLAGTIYYFFRKQIRKGAGFLKFVYLDKKELLKNRKVAFYSAAGLVFLGLLLFIPQTHSKISNSFVIQPIKQTDVRCETDGFVAQVFVQQNARVRSGQVLAKLNNPELEQAASRVAGELEIMDRQLSRLQTSQEPAAYQMKFRAREQMLQQSSELQQKLKKLLLLSPIAGKVITPDLQEKLGTYAPKGTLFCKIFDVHQVLVEIPVREYDINDVQVGQRVLLKVNAYPTETFEGTVKAVSPAIVERVEALEGTYTRIKVTVIIENPEGKLVPGMEGDARILAQEYSLAHRMTRELVRWIESRIW